jgi:hypothetical protein
VSSKGLITLKTDLKSLKYQGWNGSQPPFVTKDVNNPPSNSRIAQEVNSRVDDVVRVTKAILPTNSRFLENQAKLLQFNSETKLGSVLKQPLRTTAQNIIQRVKNTAIDLAKTSASTVAQAGVAGTGVRFGIGFKGVNGQAALQGNNIIPERVDRDDLKDKVSDIRNPKRGTYINSQGLEQTIPLEDVPNREPNSQSNPYTGKPNTALDYEAKNGTVIEVRQEGVEKSNIKDQETTTTLKTEDRFNDLNTISSNRTRSIKLTDFKSKKQNTPDRYNDPTYNKELRVNLGNSGSSPIDSLDYTRTRQSAVDKINALDIQNSKVDGTGIGRDLIKFKFEIITPDQSKFLYFRAYLDQFNDNFKGNWTETRYIGRGESMQVYDGFSRDISFGFKIAASTRVEMEPLYRKMVYLASSTAPTYGSEQGFMRGTFVRVTVGSYLYEVPGVITSVDYKWETSYPWEIAMQNPEGETDDDMQELPQIMDCSISFRPIHDFIPQTGLQPFITNPVTAGDAKNYLQPGLFSYKGETVEQSL